MKKKIIVIFIIIFIIASLSLIFYKPIDNYMGEPIFKRVTDIKFISIASDTNKNTKSDKTIYIQSSINLGDLRYSSVRVICSKSQNKDSLSYERMLYNKKPDYLEFSSNMYDLKNNQGSLIYGIRLYEEDINIESLSKINDCLYCQLYIVALWKPILTSDVFTIQKNYLDTLLKKDTLYK